MKALTLNLLLVILVTILIVFVGISYYKPIAEGISQFFNPGGINCGRINQECCGLRKWCDTNLYCIAGLCQENITYEVKIDEDYLIFNSSSEAMSASQRNDYLSAKSGLGWQDCSNAASCEGCSKVSTFKNAENCLRCSLCDETTGNCSNCLSCDYADDNNDRINEYEELYECYDCSGCTGFDKELADSCSVCSACNMANKTLIYESGLACDKCYQCDSTSNKCYSCYDCQMPNEKVCDNCTKNPATFSTDCKVKHDYDLCTRIKECIANYEGEPCEIEEMLSIPWDSTYFLNTTISNILTHCINEDLKNILPENVKQKICRYDNAKINFIQADASFVGPGNFLRPYFTSDGGLPSYSNLLSMLTSNYDFNGITGENKGILFNDCGIKTIKSLAQIPLGDQVIYNSDPQIFTPLVKATYPTQGGDIPINLKMIVDDVSWNERGGNDCSYNIYLCAQQAIATAENDTILNFYRLFAYFNESKYTFVTTPTNPNPWSFWYGSAWVNVTGIRYEQMFTVDLNGSEADVSHISKAIIAGLRDYFILNSIYNGTVKYFCYNGGLYPTYDECYLNNVSVIINDNVPWKLNDMPPADTLSEIPYYKYIYYDPGFPIYNSVFRTVDVNVTFFTFVTNETALKNKVIITPIITLRPHLRQCNDGKDNDNDGTCDWNGCGGMPADPDCNGDKEADKEDVCGNGVLEKGEECDRGPPLQDANCPGGCRTDCTCAAIYEWRCGGLKTINYHGDNHTADFESPSCNGIYKYPTSCTSESAYPSYSNDEGNYGEDVINRITIDGDHCSVRGRDVNGDNEQSRKVCVLCSNKPTTTIWGLTYTNSRGTINYPIDWYTPDIPHFPDSWYGEYNWYFTAESKTCPTFKYPVACLAKTPDRVWGEGPDWADILIDLYLDDDGKCKATWKSTEKETGNTYQFYVTLGVVCSDVQYGRTYYNWPPEEKNDNAVEKFSRDCQSGYDAVSVFSKTDHSNADNWMEDAIQTVNITDGIGYTYARDTGGCFWPLCDWTEQKRQAGILCRYVGG